MYKFLQIVNYKFGTENNYLTFQKNINKIE